MSTIDRSPFHPIVLQHVEDASALRTTRSVLIRAPHVKLSHLRRWDDRLAAHLDGISVAGEYGWRLAESALERIGAGEVFVAAVRAIHMRKPDALRRLLALAGACPEVEPGFVSAMGWVSAPALQGIVKALLSSADPLARRAGLAACALHRVDPGESLAAASVADDAGLRSSALRVAGLCACNGMRDSCLQALRDDDPTTCFWAARSGVLLGDRGACLEQLLRLAGAAGRHRQAALSLAMKLVDLPSAHALLKALHDDPQDRRLLLRTTALSGDVRFVPWLIERMGDPALARLAGESFSFITGADLAWLELGGQPPEGVESGPNDNPDDDNVAMDEDDGLPWPDPAKVRTWWAANTHRFVPGVRYFIGEPPSWSHCLGVLKDGYQRRRIAAAEHLCLLRPGMPLFNTCAPAWRQQRLLAQMGAT